MNHTLVLLSSNYPFGGGETFLETEIYYLCKSFKKVIIITHDVNSTQQRNVPINCQIIRLDLSNSIGLRIKSLLQYFNTVFSNEKKIVKTLYHKKLTLPILKTMLLSLGRAKRVKEFIQQQSFDLSSTIFYSYWCDDTALGLALLAEENECIKAVSRAHRWDVYFAVHDINYLPFRQFIAKHIKVFPISNQGKDSIHNIWKVNQEIQVARLGVKSVCPITHRQDLIQVISCSNIIPLKRLELIAKALQNITRYSIVWTHLGDGSSTDSVKAIVDNLGTNIQVNLKGRISNQEIYNLYQEIKPHLFINVSSSEGIPVSIMEAMSFGIPVLATDVGGNGEIVNNQNGYLLPANPTPQEIAEQIIRFIEMKEPEYQVYSNNAHKTWKEEYNAEKNYREFVDMLKKWSNTKI